MTFSIEPIHGETASLGHTVVFAEVAKTTGMCSLCVGSGEKGFDRRPGESHHSSLGLS